MSSGPSGPIFRGNVFVVSVSVCVCLCVCVCLSVRTITFEQVNIETSFLVWSYILTMCRSGLSIKVIGSRSWKMLILLP